MPFAAPLQMDDPNDPNKKDQGGGVNVSGQSASFATNVPGQDASSAGTQKSSGQYANIQSYLDANKQQADSMGQKISSDVSAKADEATQKIQGLDSKAPKVDSYDPNAVLNNVTTASDSDKAQYKQMKATGGYTGPDSIDKVEGYADTQKAATDASQAVKNAGTETGQQQLLKQTYQRPQYSSGENKLDQVLLQNSAGSKQALEGLGQKYGQLDQMFSGAQQKVGDAVNTANQTALANKQAFNPAETAARNALLNPIQARADKKNQDNPLAIDRIKSDSSDNVLSDETLAALGLSEGQDLYDMNLADYVTPNYTQVGLNNVATADERQKYALLSGLFDDPTMNQIDQSGADVSPVTLSKQFQNDFASKDAAAKAAMSAFDMNTSQQGLKSVFSPYYNGGKISYDDANKIMQGYVPSNQYDARRAYLMDLQAKGLIDSRQNLGSDIGFQSANMAVDELANQYNNLRTQYGITDKKVKKG